MRTRIKTKPSEIVSYWAQRENECGLGVDWAEAHERCWRCGYKTSLERCHIVPDSLNGLDDPSNLVLLCYRCHREAPNHTDPGYMWLWLRADNVPFYDTYWTNRGLREFEKMFGRKAFSDLKSQNAEPAMIAELMQESMEKATFHFGQAHLNPATVACVIADVEDALRCMETPPLP